MFKNCPNFGLKIIKITTKIYLDKNHYLIFPQSLTITNNHYDIRTPSRTPGFKPRGPIGPLGPLLGAPLLKGHKNFLGYCGGLA